MYRLKVEIKKKTLRLVPLQFLIIDEQTEAEKSLATCPRSHNSKPGPCDSRAALNHQMKCPRAVLPRRTLRGAGHVLHPCCPNVVNVTRGPRLHFFFFFILTQLHVASGVTFLDNAALECHQVGSTPPLKLGPSTNLPFLNPTRKPRRGGS